MATSEQNETKTTRPKAPKPKVEGASRASAPRARKKSGPKMKVESGGTPAANSNSGAKLHAFRGNSIDAYLDAAVSDFPLPTRIFRTIVLAIVGAFTKIFAPWSIADGSKLWDDKRGRVIVMNHTAGIDPVIVVISMWFHGITCRPIYKSEFNRIPLAPWFLSRVGAIPVERGTADIRCVRRAEWALKRGECILIFPEGTRIKSDDQPVTIHAGFALMARRGKASVQPMAIVGSRDIVSRKTHLAKPFSRVYLKVGDCVSFEELGVKGRKAQSEAMEKVAMERVYGMRDELRAEHPKKH